MLDFSELFWVYGPGFFLLSAGQQCEVLHGGVELNCTCGLWRELLSDLMQSDCLNCDFKDLLNAESQACPTLSGGKDNSAKVTKSTSGVATKKLSPIRISEHTRPH